VFQSGGEMENDERIASVIYGLITLTDKVDSLMQEDGYKRISGILWAVITFHYQVKNKVCDFIVSCNVKILHQQQLHIFQRTAILKF
jgi:hypothetical protein